MTEWQPIETAPRDGTWILGWRPTKFVADQIETWQWVDDQSFTGWINASDHNDFDEHPTHWMPLPNPPEDAT